MIRVSIELLPFGREQDKKLLKQIIIANDGTGTLNRGNYFYRAYRKGSVDRVLRTGEIKDFPRRSKSSVDLLFLVLKDLLRPGK